MKSSLKLALIHPRLEYGRSEANRAEIIRLVEQAAENGAEIILATEMAVSGYSFESRAEIADLVETDRGPTLTALAGIAAQRGVYLGLGLAEKDPGTGLYYNSAFLLSPDGRRARRRKVSAESKWACPGPSCQEDTLETPWGRLGVLICSESYYGLLVRAMALKGVDLLLVPANWPPAGLDPLKLWRARALENGLNLAAANRTGADRSMDCTPARSALFNSRGEMIQGGTGPDSLVLLAELPLKGGRLDPAPRTARLAGRTPELYHYLCSDVAMIQNPATFFPLPEEGLLRVRALSGEPTPEQVSARLAGETPGLVILPRLCGPEWTVEALDRLAGEVSSPVLARLETDGSPGLVLAREGEVQGSAPAGTGEPWIVDLEAARVGLAGKGAALHPELAVALAKRGCDLLAVSGARLNQAEQKIMSVKAVEKIALAGAFADLALGSIPPQGHQPWIETLAPKGEALSLDLETGPLRQRSFQERIDRELLLAPNKGGRS